VQPMQRRRQQRVAGHGEGEARGGEHAGVGHRRHRHHAQQRGGNAERGEGDGELVDGALGGLQRLGVEDADHHQTHPAVDGGHQREAEEDAERQVALRSLDLLGDGRDLGDAGVGHEDKADGGDKAARALGEEVVEVGGVELPHAGDDEAEQAHQRQADDARLRLGELLDAPVVHEHDEEEQHHGHDDQRGVGVSGGGRELGLGHHHLVFGGGRVEVGLGGGHLLLAADEHREVGAEAHERERTLQQQRQPQAQAGDGPDKGPERAVEIDIGAARGGHGGGQLRLRQGRRQHTQAGGEVGEEHARAGELGGQAREHKNAAAQHRADADGHHRA
jgi:hypothetical protein